MQDDEGNPLYPEPGYQPKLKRSNRSKATQSECEEEEEESKLWYEEEAWETMPHELPLLLSSDEEAVKHPEHVKRVLPEGTKMDPLNVIQLLRQRQLREINAELKRVSTLPYIKLDSCVDVGDSAREPIEDKLNEFLDWQGSGRSLLLLGDSGGGKSLTLLHLAHRLWSAYEEGDPIPLWLELDREDDPDHGLIQSYLRRHIGCNAETVEQLQHEQRWILLLDAFDEIPNKRDLYNTERWDKWDLKVITGCRTQALVGVVDNYRKWFVPIANDRRRWDWLRQRVLQSFSNDQVKDYLTIYCAQHQQELTAPWDESQHYLDQIKQIAGIAELLHNPFMLQAIVKVMPRLAAHSVNKINRYELLKVYLEEHMSREAIKCQRRERLRSAPYRDFEARLFVYAQSLALAMFIEDPRKQSVQPGINKIIVRPENEWSSFFELTDQSRYRDWQIEGCPLNERAGKDQQGEYVEYRFRHKSLLEYLALRAMLAELKRAYHKEAGVHWLDSDRLYTLGLNQKRLNEERDFLEMLAGQIRQHKWLKKALYALIDASRERHDITLAAANSATALTLAGKIFSGLNWSVAKLAGADLSQAIFDQTDLQGADLRWVRLLDCYLNGAQLQKANMRGVDFGQQPYLEHECLVNSVCYSPDGQWLATGDCDHTVRLWRVSDGQCVLELRGNAQFVTSVSFSGDSQWLASGSSGEVLSLKGVDRDKTVRLWRVSDGQCVLLRGHTDHVLNVSFSADSQWLASGSMDKTVRLWRVSDRKCVRELKEHTDGVCCVSFSADSQWLASGSYDKTIRLWRVSDGQWQFVQDLKGHTDHVLSVSFSADSQWLASGSMDKTVRLWRVSDWKCVRELKERTDGVCCVSFSVDGKWMASGSTSTVRLWRVSDWKCVRVLRGLANWINSSVSFSVDGRWMASVDGGKVRLWRVLNRQIDRELPSGVHASGWQLWDRDSWVRTREFSANGRWRAWEGLGNDNTVSIMRMSHWKCVKVLKGHTGRVRKVGFSADSQWLASGSEDKTVRLWRVSDWKCVRVLEGHSGCVSSVSFSADGQWLASGSYDKTIRLWRVSDGQCVRELKGYTRTSARVIFSADGSWLASGTFSDLINLWKVRATLETIQCRLHWCRTSPLSSADIQLADVIGLSSMNRRLLAQHSHGTLSEQQSDAELSGISELTNAEIQSELRQANNQGRSQNRRQRPASMMPCYRRSPRVLTHNNWQVTWLMWPRSDHHMLLLEGVDESGRVLKQVLVDHQQLVVRSIPVTLLARLTRGVLLRSWLLASHEARGLLRAVDQAKQQQPATLSAWIDEFLTALDLREKSHWPKWQSCDHNLALAAPDSRTWALQEKRGFTREISGQAVRIQLDTSLPAESDDYFKALESALAACKRYQDIDLSHDHLGDKAVVLICLYLAKCSKLSILRLSHNRITKKDLVFLLKACAKHPTIKQLLLDNNEISFDAHFAENRLMPLIRETQLGNVDLSLNYIHKGAAQPELGANGRPVIVVYNKDDRKRYYRDKHDYCQTLFFTNPQLHSSVLCAVRSVIDPSMQIDQANGMIGLFAYKTNASLWNLGGFFGSGEHAFIVMEGVHRFGQRFLLMGDLYSVGRSGVMIQVCRVTPAEFRNRTIELKGVYVKKAPASKKQLQQLKSVMLASKDEQEFLSYVARPNPDKVNEHSCLSWALRMLWKAEIISDNQASTWIPSWEVGNEQSILAKLI